MISLTLIIIIVTGFISYTAFNKPELLYKFLHNPVRVIHHKEYSRLLSHGFIHGGWAHLIFNMYVFWMFGVMVEQVLIAKFALGKIYFLLLYFGAMLFATVPSLIKHKNNPNYNSLGASGAVSAMVFASIIIQPINELGILFIPFGIPGFIFGPLYLLAEYYLDKRGNSPIAHDAHMYGALFGVVFMIVISPDYVPQMIEQIGFYIKAKLA